MDGTGGGHLALARLSTQVPLCARWCLPEACREAGGTTELMTMTDVGETRTAPFFSEVEVVTISDYQIGQGDRRSGGVTCT